MINDWKRSDWRGKHQTCRPHLQAQDHMHMKIRCGQSRSLSALLMSLKRKTKRKRDFRRRRAIFNELLLCKGRATERNYHINDTLHCEMQISFCFKVVRVENIGKVGEKVFVISFWHLDFGSTTIARLLANPLTTKTVFFGMLLYKIWQHNNLR